MKKLRLGIAAVTLTLLTATTTACQGSAASDDVIRLGALNSYNTLTISQDGVLKEQLPDTEAKVEWTPGFEAFVPALEAAQAGQIDGGSGGLTNVFTGLQGGGDFKVIGVEDSSEAMGVVASGESGITSIDDLAGHTIAVNKGGTGEYLAHRAIDKAGISAKDVTFKFLSPSDGISAFQSGSVDAIAVWDQYFATAQQQPGAQVLANGTDLDSKNYLFQWVTSDFAKKHPEDVAALVKGLEESSAETSKNPQSIIDLYTKQGADPTALEVIRTWKPYGFEPIGEEQKKLVEEHGQDLVKYGIIDEAVDVSDAFFDADEQA